MFSAEELLTGAQPYLAYAGPSSAAISTGQAGPMTNGVSGDVGASLGGATARVRAGASGSAILITWLAIIVILIAANVLTLKVQG